MTEEITISQIIKARRRTLSIQITPEGEVVVKAPLLTPNFIIRKFVREKESWIRSHLEKMAAKPKIKRQYGEGEEFLYLGKEYKLHFGNFSRITFTQSRRLDFPEFLKFRIQKELTDLYFKLAKELIVKRTAYHAQRMKVQYGNIMLSDTKSKWGTCTYHNNLQFNWRLIMAPLEVIDYVIIHELSHTKEKNHSRKFWNIVSLETPAYKQHRKWLYTNAHRLKI